MSKDYIPEYVNPFRFAENATSLHGRLLIKKMERLVPSLYSNDGEIRADIQFGIDDQGIRYVKGHMETQLVLQCQRCLQSFEYGIAGDFMSGLVSGEEEAKTLPSRYDQMVIKDETLNIQDMIEEELIISLPLVPMHDPKDCKMQLPLSVGVDLSEVSVEKENPFKVIETLRGKLKKE